MKAHLIRYAPWYGAGLALLYFGFYLLPHHESDKEFHYAKFGEILTIEGGRPKPMDTVARINLMILTHRQSFYDPETKKHYPATKWMLDVLANPIPGDKLLKKFLPNGDGSVWDQKVFRIENDQLIHWLDLKMVEGLRYSIIDIAPKYTEIGIEATRLMGDEEQGIKGVDPKRMSLKDAKLLELAQHLRLFTRLSTQDTPLVIPDPNGTTQWKTFRDHLQDIAAGGVPVGNGIDDRTFQVYYQLVRAYQEGDVSKFNGLLDKHLAEMEKTQPAQMQAVHTEIFFNEFAPFYRCLSLYVLIALIGALSWLMVTWSYEWSEPLRTAAYAAMAVTFAFHLFGLILRMYLQNRMFVFVTNLYSSAIFIGLGCVFMCLIVEWFYRNGIAIVVGSVCGFCTLIIAHLLSLDGDTMVMMEAVLDTNFWLATHVTCVTLGYATTFVAGVMGIAYIFLGMFTNMLRKDGSANLTRMTYGVLCAGMFLSFVGTVLGGLWADYSWGRFWGWDPKENGALLIVIWIALILHARWGGMVKHRGIAVLSVMGIIVTSWSYFGTNFLGVGLHAYGGAKGNAMLALILIDLLFLSIAGLGLVPLHHWQSFRAPSTIPPPTTGTPGKPTMARV
jgi:ABC-type transport system involved in cytochrome c biogenesis permease subunit